MSLFPDFILRKLTDSEMETKNRLDFLARAHRESMAANEESEDSFDSEMWNKSHLSERA